jgi:hypothetical protein
MRGQATQHPTLLDSQGISQKISQHQHFSADFKPFHSKQEACCPGQIPTLTTSVGCRDKSTEANFQKQPRAWACKQKEKQDLTMLEL